MTTTAWALLGVSGVAAVANWWSRWTDDRRTELWSKPLALAALIGVAWTLEPADDAVRAWFVVALVCSLLGDLFLLDGDRWFVAGLGSFLVAHLAYVVGFVVADRWRWWAVAAALAVVVAVAATIGRRVVAGAQTTDPALRVPVVAYLAVISAMVVAAAGAGNGFAVAGAALFMVSDSVLGWRQFVSESRWMPVTIMVTYHLGQAGLVASLLP
jgi:uncharacterized membrane protein YhhN